MLIMRIAWRSFLRHRRRSIITATAISFGLALMLISFGIGNSAHNNMADMGIRLGAGHVIVQGKGFQAEQTLDYSVSEPDEILAQARKISGVVTAVPRVTAGGLISTGAASARVMVAGVDPALEPQASLIAAPERRVVGEYLRRTEDMPYASQPADIYVGVTLAETLALAVDDRVILTVSPRGDDRPRTAAFIVRGVFRTGIADLDNYSAQIPIDVAQKLFHLGTDVTQIAVLCDGLDRTAGAVDALRARLRGRADFDQLEIMPWQEALRELYEAIVLDDAGNYFMMAIIFVIVAIGIFNTVLMSVIERTREFGVMMAIGTSARQMFAIVMAEAFVLGVVSVAVGLALGLSVHYYFASHGLDLTALYGEDLEMAGIVFEGRIYSDLAASSVTLWALVVLAIVVLSAIYPALRATRLDPVEAMRHA